MAGSRSARQYSGLTMIKYFALLAALLAASAVATAQEPSRVAPRHDAQTTRIPLPNSTLPISAAVWAGDTLYISGSLDPDPKAHTDTTSQTVGLLKDLQKLLESQHLTLGDVVMMHVYLGADPAKDGKMDFDGMMAGYSQFFGTREQPNKPARTTVQVVLPAGVRGALVEIDMIAVRPR